ncbi:MAG: hypothetical protein WC410_00280 [Candidatus Paceibacterota bacterium]
MKKLEKTKRDIRKEVRGRDMRERIRAKAERMVEDLQEEIGDEVGDLMGKLMTDIAVEDSSIEAELTGCAYDEIERALLGEIRKQLE